MPQTTKTIAFLLADFQSGGTEWFALRLARGMLANNTDRKNIKPVFLTLHPEGDLKPLIDHDIEIVSLNGRHYTFFQTLQTLPAMVRFLRTHQPDALIGGLTILNIVASLALLIARTKTRFIAVEHIRLEQSATSVTAKIKHAIKITLVRLAYAKADKIVAVSKTTKDDLVKHAQIDPTRIAIIHNPIIPQNFESLREEPPPHPWLCEPNIPTIIGIGRLLANKDFANLIQAFAEVRKETNARLLIFGDGEERDNLQHMINVLKLSSAVYLAGPINNVFSALNAADVLALPSRSESFGNVIVEALACGCPVVSTDCGGPREILEGGALGTLVPTNNPQALAEAIIKTLATPPPGKGQRLARGQSFSVEKAVNEYLALLG